MSRTFIFDPENPRRMDVLRFMAEFVVGQAKRLAITVSEPKRNNEANSAMWCLLADVAAQVGWKQARWRGDRCIEEGRYVLLRDDPKAKRLTDEEFKDVISAAWKRPRMFGGIDGGVVAVGVRTSRMTQAEIRDLMTLIEVFGAGLGVEWTPVPAKEMAA